MFVAENGEDWGMEFKRFSIRIGMGILLAFSWSFGAVIIGIHKPGSTAFPIFGFGIGIIFILGLWIGGNLAKKWFPIKEDDIAVTKDRAAPTIESRREVTDKDGID
jgi:hypothetical protein